MASYVDCGGCGWLIRVEERRCPFCNAGGTSAAPAMAHWALGMTLAVGFGMVGCGPTEDGMETVADSQEADAVTYAGPDENTSTTVGDGPTSISDTVPDADAVTYAGPDETWSTSYDSASSSETTYDPTDADAVTYAGPDEDSSTTDPVETSTGGSDSSSSTG